MALKKLGKFTYFDIEGFLANKKLVVTATQDWLDFETKKLLGTKIEVVIIVDETDYGTSERNVTNVYEKLLVKVGAKIDVPANAEIRLLNAQATVFGDFRNQLSIVADGIEVVGKS